MPRLVIIAPCVDFIIGQDNSLSIIRIVDRLMVDAAAAAAAPADGDRFSSPLHVLASWAREGNDTARIFEQRLRIMSPSGDTAIERFVRFQFTDDATGHYTIARIDAFPVHEAGTYDIEISLRIADSDDAWQLCNSHPFRISHDGASEQALD